MSRWVIFQPAWHSLPARFRRATRGLEDVTTGRRRQKLQGRTATTQLCSHEAPDRLRETGANQVTLAYGGPVLIGHDEVLVIQHAFRLDPGADADDSGSSPGP